MYQAVPQYGPPAVAPPQASFWGGIPPLVYVGIGERTACSRRMGACGGDLLQRVLACAYVCVWSLAGSATQPQMWVLASRPAARVLPLPAAAPRPYLPRPCLPGLPALRGAVP